MKTCSFAVIRSCGVITCLTLLSVSYSIAGTFCVAPNGDDKNPGTKGKPFATIQAARDAARAKGGKGHVILLAPGRYFNDTAIVLDDRDSGLTIKGEKSGAVAEVYGGQLVTGWEKWKGNIWRAPVPKGKRFFNLIVDGHIATMAQNPKAGSGYGGGVKPCPEPRDTWRPRDSVIVPDAWKGYDYSDAQVFGFHDSNWFSETHAILAPPDENGNMKITKGNIWTRLFVRGVLEFLTEPGEWCLKNKEGYVYYWPKTGTPADHVIVRATTEKLFVVQGRAPETPVKNVTIENLSIIGSDFAEAWAPGKDNTAPNPQGMIFGENVEGLTVRGCRLLSAGHSAVFLNKYAQKCVVENNLIMEAGFVGVYMNGWPIFEGPFKDAAESYVNKEHRIESNFIYDCGKFIGAGCGIQFYQSGDNVVTRNEVGQMPRYGISYKGLCYVSFGRGEAFGKKITWDNHWEFIHTRNNKIAGNEIYSVCRNSHDFGAIEAWGPGRDNLWDNNAVHDVDATLEWDGYGNILYADDHNHYLTMQNNILYFCNGGVVSTAFSMKSVRQTTENNFVVDSSLGIICGLGPVWEPCWGSIVRHNAIAITPKNTLYAVGEGNFKGFTGGRLPKLPEGEKGIIEIDYNAVLPKDKANPNPKLYVEHGIDLHSTFTDLMVKRAKPVWDIQYADYSLAQESPAFKVGFKTIPTKTIGLRRDFPFDKVAATRRSAFDKIQAEDYQRMMDLRTQGGVGIFHIGKGAWAKYANIDFGNGAATRAEFKLEGQAANAKVEMRLDAPTGALIATLSHGQTVCPVTRVTGVHNVYLVFPEGGVQSIDWFRLLLPADAAVSTVEASPAVVANDGVSTSTMTVTVKDRCGNFVPAAAVTLQSNRGATDTISPTSSVSNDKGEVTFSVHSATAGQALFTAADVSGGLTFARTASVTFSSNATSVARSSAVVAPGSVRANGQSTATVTVTLRDGCGKTVAGKQVMLEKIAGAGAPEITAINGTTDASGVARFQVKSSQDDAFKFKVVNVTDHMALAQPVAILFTPMADAQPVLATRSDGYTVATFTSGKGTWTVPAGVTKVEVLVVGGGGGGGQQSGGAGGGGFYYATDYAVTAASPITVRVGDGGAPGKSGSPSVFGPVIAYGGAGTEDYHSITAIDQTKTSSEGGEQGGCFDGSIFHPGHSGGATSHFDGAYDSGGGAGATGSHGNTAVGGIGAECRITGTAQYYAAGGGALEATVGAQGGAGHRTGGTFGSATYQPVIENTGAGGQGGWGVQGNKGAAGVVIIAYKPAVN